MQARQYKFGEMMARLLAEIHSRGYCVRFGDFWRSTDRLKVPGGAPGFEDDESYAYQELLFYNRRSKVTHSDHNDRCAGDLMLGKDGRDARPEDYRQFGEFWESLGGEWGGRYGVKPEQYAERLGWDIYHFGLRA